MEDDGDGDSNGDPKKQCTLPTVLNRPSIPANKLCGLLAEYVIEDLQPLPTVVKAFMVYSNSFDSTSTPIEEPEEEREDDTLFKNFHELLTFDCKEVMMIPPRCIMSCHHIIGVQHTLLISLQAKMQINSFHLPQCLKVFIQEFLC